MLERPLTKLSVLILVLVEDGLEALECQFYVMYLLVLILVLVEDGLEATVIASLTTK